MSAALWFANGVELNLEADGEIQKSLAALPGQVDVIIAVKTLESATADGFVREMGEGRFAFLDLLFCVCRTF